MRLNQPWSSKHKQVFKGCPYSLSNSFAEPLTHQELVEYAKARGDQSLIDEYHNHRLTYTPNGGSEDLRHEISNLYGPNITADNILVCAGAQVALQTAAFAVLATQQTSTQQLETEGSKDMSANATEGYHSIVFTPGYQSTIEAPIQAGSRVTYIPRRPSKKWQINMQDVRDAIEGNTKFILLNEPYNPAGTLMSKYDQKELVSIAEENDIVILCDEVYRLLEHDPSKDRLEAMADAYKKGMSVVTLSKPWGGCGITIGWIAFQDTSMRQTLLDTLYFGTACPSRASEIQAIMTLRASDLILERNLPILQCNLKLLEDVIENQYPDLLEWVKPTAGAVAFVKFKGPLSSEELGSQLAQRGVSIKPSFCFTDHVTPEIDYFRVGYGESIMPKALEKFVAFFEEHKEGWRSNMEQK